MLAVLVELETHGPMSFSYPFVALSPPTYPLPPQTTIAGALAYPVLKNNAREDQVINGKMYSSAASIANKVRYATAGCKGYVISRTLERIFQLPYLDKKYWKWEYKHMFFSIGQRGIVSYLDNTLYLFMIIEDELLKYVWGITRLGRKENIVSVRNVLTAKISEARLPTEEVSTTFYVPTDIVENCIPAEVYSMPIIDIENYSFTPKPVTKQFYVPTIQLSTRDTEITKMTCKPRRDRTVVFEFKVNSQDIKVIVDRSVLEWQIK